MKQVIVVRKDLSMSPGKLAAQACHASVGAYQAFAGSMVAGDWNDTGMTKIVLEAQDLKELMQVFESARTAGLRPYLVCDAGHTELQPGTLTCVGIGPSRDEAIDKITGHLGLF